MTEIADMDPGERAFAEVITRYQDTIKELRAEKVALREAVIEECAAKLDELAQKATGVGRDGGDFTSAAWAIRALKGNANG